MMGRRRWRRSQTVTASKTIATRSASALCVCVCGGGEKQDPDKQILCGECDMAFHLWLSGYGLALHRCSWWWGLVCVFTCAYGCTLTWWPFRYCPQCKTDVLEVIKAGEKLRLSKKKAKMVSKKQETNRDWGKVGFGFCRDRWVV